ncbi:CO/xanthine dehydrogenase FAD-binding subunit [Lederbergia galactosidilyticus]|uniref:FAD binding domain-containing protein n=1 Tax=Lederbergia galactosidilytica TaxID=217031 RepID=UPI001AE6A805|nr:FAD binding domain-containing protein [Lederbergia galactosidilytica]MBP1915809.1 CO/xanthine dehydrogenase FAD-binding subunit [Lederbergia galactosidilytica]
MISYDFAYYESASIAEATSLFVDLDQQGKSPLFFSGGTEIITLGRLNLVKTGAVIDIKGILECNMMELNEDTLIIGAAKTLTDIEEMNLFPLLSKTVREIADRTARNKITVGGNICGQIFYREAVLPFLLADSQMVIAGSQGITTVPIGEVFNEQLLLNRGEFLVQIKTNRRYIEMPFISVKRRRQWNTGYPLITVAVLKVEEKLRVAISGLTHFPFRASQIEDFLNRVELTYEERIELALSRLDVPVLDDTEGSSGYRLFVLKNTLYDILRELGGEENGVV